LQVQYFVYTHLLHWLEALSLIGRLDIAYWSLDRVRQMKEVSD
jgi:cytochrome b561